MKPVLIGQTECMAHTESHSHPVHAWRGPGRLGTEGRAHHHHARHDHVALSSAMRAGRILLLSTAVVSVLAAVLTVLLH